MFSHEKIYQYYLTLYFVFRISCSSFLEEDPRDGLLGDNGLFYTVGRHRNGVHSLYNCVGSYKDSEGLQGTGRGIYDLNTFTTDEAIMPTRGGDWYDGGFWQGLYLHQWGVNNEAILPLGSTCIVGD